MIYQQIIDYLAAEYRGGKTYQQIASEHGLSLGYIRDLVTRRRRVESMALETFFKMFPSARIELAPAHASDAPAASVPLADYQDLRERYQDLRDKYQDLREQYLDLKSRPPYTLDGAGPAAPYRVPSTPSSSIK